MVRKSQRPTRRAGSALIENAIVLPVAFLLILGLVCGASGIFDYNQVAHLAAVTARFAATHGGTYALENATAIKASTLPTIDEAYLINLAKTHATGIDTSKLTVKVSINSGTGTYDWDATGGNNMRAVTSTATQGQNKITVNNTVSVTVTYQWSPVVYLTGPITMTAIWVQPMSY